MINENENPSTEVAPSADANLVDKLTELKRTTVSRDEYNRLMELNAKLTDALATTPIAEPKEVEAASVDVESLRNDLFNKELSNLEFAEKSLVLRDELIRRGEKDPFLPWGQKIVPTEEDVQTANRVAAVLKECVEYAQGDSNIFTSELQRRTVDTGIRRK